MFDVLTIVLHWLHYEYASVHITLNIWQANLVPHFQQKFPS
jgi:hypothetical protein